MIRRAMVEVLLDPKRTDWETKFSHKGYKAKVTNHKNGNITVKIKRPD